MISKINIWAQGIVIAIIIATVIQLDFTRKTKIKNT